MTTPQPPQEYPEERRLATVLFADIQGFTALSEQQDFEAVSELIKEVWQILDRVIVDYGGFIDKHIGDEVMAVWGAPHAGEDDTERAVSCALALQDALVTYTAQSKRDGAQELQLRVGINTGQVLATYVGLKNEYTVMGDTVNIAKRLAEYTDPGTILTSESTYRMVRGAFDVKQTEPMELRGKTQKITGFLIVGKLEQPSRVRYTDFGSLETIMVGRDAEMGALAEQFTLIRNAAVPAFVLIMGEIGLGKSRLMMEFMRKLDLDPEPVVSLSLRGVSEAAQAPFFVWRTMWKDRFGINENLGVEQTREKFLRGIIQLWGNKLGQVSAVEAAHVIGDMIGLTWENSPYLKEHHSPDEKMARAFSITQEVFYRIAQTGPIFMVVDDLQWIDQPSLNLLDFLLRPGPSILPMLICGGARPEFLRTKISWANKGKVINLERVAFTADLVKQAYPTLENCPKKYLNR